LNDTKNRTKRSSITNNFWRNAIGYDHIHSVYAPYTIVYIVYTLRIRSPYFAVFLRIRSRSYTIVIRSHVFRRNTVVYGAYMTCIRSYTPSYTTVYDRIRSPYPSTWADNSSISSVLIKKPRSIGSAPIKRTSKQLL
jgi:hypothetical protein